jgi:hypothetical protein
MKAAIYFYYTTREPKYFNSYREAYDWACVYNRDHPYSTSIAVPFEEK